MILPDQQNLLEENEQTGGELEEPTYTIVEGNLQRQHFAMLATKAKDKKRLVSTVEEKETNEQGIAKVSRWKVIGGGEFGLPNWLDKKVLVAVIDAARRKSYPVVNPIPLNINEICRQVGFNPESGRNRTLVRTSLARINGTTIEAVGAFYYKQEEARISDRFSVFQRVIFAQAQLEDGTRASHTMVWLSDKIISNLNKWYIVPVDTKFFMNLVPIAGRLYELLSSRFFALFMKLSRQNRSLAGCYIVETYDGICKRMPLTVRAHRSRAQEQFAKAHQQLVNARYLARVEWHDNNEIHYYAGPKAIYDFQNAQREITRQMALPFNPRELIQPKERLTLEVEGKETAENGSVTLEIVSEDTPALEEEKTAAKAEISAYTKRLEEKGVSRKQARTLATDFHDKETEWEGRSYPTIDFYIQYFDWLVSTDSPKKPSSGAWLVSAIREVWQPPLEFKTAEQKEADRRAVMEEKRRRKAAEQAQDEARSREHYLEWLGKTPEQRWRMEEFMFPIRFKREQGRDATFEEIKAARDAYLAAPEPPEAYQTRIYGKVKYPLTLEEAKTNGKANL